MAKILLEGWQCERCGHKWVPREGTGVVPKVCPRCKSPYWATERKKPAPGQSEKNIPEEPDKE